MMTMIPVERKNQGKIQIRIVTVINDDDFFLRDALFAILFENLNQFAHLPSRLIFTPIDSSSSSFLAFNRSIFECSICQTLMRRFESFVRLTF
jgi:hypothetical protein